jgi:hypothetical protein
LGILDLFCKEGSALWWRERGALAQYLFNLVENGSRAGEISTLKTLYDRFWNFDGN